MVHEHAKTINWTPNKYKENSATKRTKYSQENKSDFIHFVEHKDIGLISYEKIFASIYAQNEQHSNVTNLPMSAINITPKRG